jgi:hypothetical protein
MRLGSSNTSILNGKLAIILVRWLEHNKNLVRRMLLPDIVKCPTRNLYSNLTTGGLLALVRWLEHNINLVRRMHIPPTIYPSPAQEFVHVIVTRVVRNHHVVLVLGIFSRNGITIFLYCIILEYWGEAYPNDRCLEVQNPSLSSSYVDPTPLVHLVLLLLLFGGGGVIIAPIPSFWMKTQDPHHCHTSRFTFTLWIHFGGLSPNLVNWST